MYGYFDESIISVDGVKYLFLGFIVFEKKQTENIILREFARTRSKLKNQKEIKSFDFGNSKSFPGIQYADWIAGEASEKFKQKNRQ